MRLPSPFPLPLQGERIKERGTIEVWYNAAMKIVVDRNIPFAEDAFGTLGEVVVLPGREISADLVKDADALIVRSVTKVNEGLLRGSSVRFVATSTIGTDHVDEAYLAEKGIGFISAPGSNSNSVAEYVTAALLVLSERQGRTLAGSSIAVVGVGNVGSKVARNAEALGMNVMRNDPPLARKTKDKVFRSLNEVIGCDIVTVHVPLTRDGEDPTYHLADQVFLGKMSSGAIFINTSRGAVSETSALIDAIGSGHVSAVIDVWENEPEIDVGLLKKAGIGTSHIAGYSFDGKVNAVIACYTALCEFEGLEPTWSPDALMPPSDVPELEINCAGRKPENIIKDAVLSVYDILGDDTALRRSLDLPGEGRGPYFDRLRAEYPRRREFFNTKVRLKNGSEDAKKRLGAIGFKASSSDGE